MVAQSLSEVGMAEKVFEECLVEISAQALETQLA